MTTEMTTTVELGTETTSTALEETTATETLEETTQTETLEETTATETMEETTQTETLEETTQTETQEEITTAENSGQENTTRQFATEITNASMAVTNASETTSESNLFEVDITNATVSITKNTSTTESSVIDVSTVSVSMKSTAAENLTTAALIQTKSSPEVTSSAATTTTKTTVTTVTTKTPTTTLSTTTATKSTTLQSVTTVKSNATLPTPIPTLLPTRPPENVLYSVSSDSYLSDLSANATPSGGQPIETVPGPFGFGAGVRLEAEDENCLHRSNFYDGPKAECFNDLSNCSDSGLSVSIWVNIQFNDRDTTSRYILSTGGDTEGVPGLAIYYKGVDVHAVVSNGTHYWAVYALGPVPNNTWSNIGLRWAEVNGWEMYVDQERVAKVVYPTAIKGPPKPAVQPPEIAVGCHVQGKPLQFTNYSDGKFDEVVVWFHQLNDTELPYFSGGYDPNSANMSVTNVVTIITKKLNLTDPEEHQQAVDILAKMTDPSGQEKSNDQPDSSKVKDVTRMTATASTTLDDNNSTSSATTSTTKSFLDSANKNRYTYSEANQQPSNDATITEKNINKLTMIQTALNDMTKKTNIKPNMSFSEMTAFQNALKIYSNIFDSSNKEEWQQINHNSKNGTMALVQSILQWSIDLSKQTMLKTRSNSFQYTKVTDNIVLTTRKMTVDEFAKNKGLVLPNYEDSQWDSVPWREGSPKLPLDSTQFSRELLTGLQRPPGSHLYIASSVFSTMSELAPTSVNADSFPSSNMIIDSKVVAVLMEPLIGMNYAYFYNPIRVTLAHIHKEPTLNRKLLFHDESYSIPTIKYRYCARWNPSVKPNGGWDSTGCEMYYTNEQYSICNCDHAGPYAILAQNIQRRMIYPDPDWLMYLKYAFYGLSAVALIFYICAIIISKHLKDQFHIIRSCICLATLSGSACMFTTDFIRGDRHVCTAVTAVLHYSYVAVASWLLMESHALFGTMMHGTIGGKLKAYFPFAWGCPMLCLGIAIISDFKDYGLEPRCMVSWNDNLKWTLFSPILIFGITAIALTSATILNTSFAAVKKEMIFEDVSSVAWGLLFVSTTFVFNWIFACLAYLDIEYMHPDFYPIFQVLNAGLGFLMFIFMGLGSKRFRMVLRGKTPDSRHLPSVNQKQSNLIPVKPQPNQQGSLK